MAIKLKLTKPEPKFTTVEEFRTHLFSMTLYSTDKKRLNDPTDYPCFKCGGKGKIRKMEDRDPVEGFKGAPWYDCGKCEGKGKLHKAEYEPIVEQKLDAFERKLKAYEKTLARFESIMKKLEPEEVEFLLSNVETIK